MVIKEVTKYLKNDRGTVQFLVVVLVIAAVAVVAYAIFDYTYSHQKSAGSTPTYTSPTPTPMPTNQQLITDAVRAKLSPNTVAGTTLTLCKLQGNFASVGEQAGNGPYAGSGELLLKKKDGAWSVVYSTQNMSDAAATQLGFPTGFVDSCSSQTTVLYKY